MWLSPSPSWNSRFRAQDTTFSPLAFAPFLPDPQPTEHPCGRDTFSGLNSKKRLSFPMTARRSGGIDRARTAPDLGHISPKCTGSRSFCTVLLPSLSPTNVTDGPGPISYLLTDLARYWGHRGPFHRHTTAILGPFSTLFSYNT